MDFYRILDRSVKNGLKEIYADLIVTKSKDLMTRGGAFYAVWNEEENLWSTDEQKVREIIDRDLEDYYNKVKDTTESNIKVRYFREFANKSWIEYKTFIKNLNDNHKQLDSKLAFQNTNVKKTDYVSRRLPYPLEEGDYSAFDELIGTLYDPEERAKLEWAIGAVVSGDAKKLQKFVVLYGDAGAGKSTILNVIQKLFEGYYTTFEAKALAAQNNAFSTEVFKTNPLVAIQHDGDLSKIEDNTKLNSIISHEEMTVNEKHKSQYTTKFNCFLFMGTNKPVKITDGKSGIIRRLIDVRPSGNKLPPSRYRQVVAKIDFELGAIAHHCLEVYKKMGKDYYADYTPLDMMYKTDAFFNFVEDNFQQFQRDDGVSGVRAYSMYKSYCEECMVQHVKSYQYFREELKNYFREFHKNKRVDGVLVRSYYEGFLAHKFEEHSEKKKPEVEEDIPDMEMQHTLSHLDTVLKDCKAQYASSNGIPITKWDSVTTTLKDLDTKQIHFVKVPEQHIVIDFDLVDDKGNKSMELNMEAASKWPPTYTEFSKSGAGIHLHYIYEGDVTRLSKLYSECIEVKVFTGNSSLRRKVSKCNNLPIATLNSGLPLKGEKMINFDTVKSEKGLRDLIKRNLGKEIHPGTKPSIDFINKILDDAYDSGMVYDVSDLRPKVLYFANNSHNQSDYCVKLVGNMKFKSNHELVENTQDYEEDELVFFDVEVFPNLFIVVWKKAGKPCVRMINPTPAEIENILRFKLVGFNCRRYDNHILYARYLGYSNEDLYKQSQRIIQNSPNAMFSEAYNLSYTDVYDFASAGNKKSLKKFEIELGIHHQELGLPWDEPVSEDMWVKVAEYCDNDVIATEAVFNHLSGDWTARQILADVAGMTYNDTTNQLTTRIIFGSERAPQSEFFYRDMSQPIEYVPEEVSRFLTGNCIIGLDFEREEGKSALPFFPGYKFEFGKSTYRGETVGEGGYVYAEPGMYTNVALLDVASMHPTSCISECHFGPKYTKAFKEIKDSRLHIKHKDFEMAAKMLDGKLAPYLNSDKYKPGDLSNALKTAINSVYGLTSAKFDNKFRDPRNIDNLVAKRGALFMIDLKHAVQEKGFTVAHIKTDSIKIPNATQEIIDFVMEFGKKYGYDFEHEETYERMCLVNDAVYIARTSDGHWSATGAQFAQPYVYKTLFSREPIEFKDLCETKSVTSSLYLDFNENKPDVSQYEKVKEMRWNPDKKYTNKDMILLDSFESYSDKEIDELIETGHDYRFVGKVGAFCPMKPNVGAGVLLREKDGKFYSATGSKGYRWMEAEVVESLNKIDDIDHGFYIDLVDTAVETMSKYGDVEWFTSEN